MKRCLQTAPRLPCSYAQAETTRTDPFPTLLQAFLLILLGVGCVSPPEAQERPVTEEMLRDAVDRLPPAEPGTLRVALAFGRDSDFDLGVTDPTLDAVRFAQPRGAHGGRISADRGCGDPAPRVEIVTWKDVCPGRFEISVERVADCGPSPNMESEASRQWQLRIDHAGVEWREGRIDRDAFIPIEFEVERTNSTPGHCRR